MDDSSRFWSKVDNAAGPDACWPWTAFCNSDGYGQFWADGRLVRSHRAAWGFTYGPIPEGVFVCHSCDNPSCCNPAHLWLGTNAENVADMVAKGRAVHRRGNDNGRRTSALLTMDAAAKIRGLYATGAYTYQELGHMFGVTKSCIGLVVRRETWADQVAS